MAFGVKWNRPRASAVGLRGARTNRPRPRPRPRALPADLLRGWRGGTARRSLQPPRPRPPPLHCRQAGKGEEGGGPEPSAIFPASPKHTRTHSARLTHGHGHTLAGRRPRAPPSLARVRAVSGTGRSPPPRQPATPKGGALTHTHPLAPSSPTLQPARGSGRRRARYSPNTTRESPTKRAKRRRETRCKSSIPGPGLTWEHPKPGAGEGQKYGRLRMAGGIAAFDAYRPTRGRALTLAALG